MPASRSLEKPRQGKDDQRTRFVENGRGHLGKGEISQVDGENRSIGAGLFQEGRGLRLVFGMSNNQLHITQVVLRLGEPRLDGLHLPCIGSPVAVGGAGAPVKTTQILAFLRGRGGESAARECVQEALANGNPAAIPDSGNRACYSGHTWQ